jgi:hypothetical protein
VAKLVGLRFLSLRETKLRLKGAQQVGTMTSLHKLSIADCTKLTDKGLACIAKLPNLYALDATGTKVTPEGLLCLIDMPHLRELAYTCEDAGGVR